MLALGDEALEIGLRVAEIACRRHANNIEALRARLFGKRVLDRGCV